MDAQGRRRSWQVPYECAYLLFLLDFEGWDHNDGAGQGDLKVLVALQWFTPWGTVLVNCHYQLDKI